MMLMNRARRRVIAGKRVGNLASQYGTTKPKGECGDRRNFRHESNDEETDPSGRAFPQSRGDAAIQ